MEREIVDTPDAPTPGGFPSFRAGCRSVRYGCLWDDQTIANEDFALQPPARACMPVARPPRDVQIEIEAVALTS